VRVIVEGETPKARVEVERISVDEAHSGRQGWDEERFFEKLVSGNAPPPVRQLANKLRELVLQYPESLSLSWGTGKTGSMILKRNDGGLIEVWGSGSIYFRPRKFERALGEEGGQRYRAAVAGILPGVMTMVHPHLGPAEAASAASELYALIREAIESAERS
jgi:hypothetical protein